MNIYEYLFFQEWADHDIRNLTTYFMILTSMSFNIFIVCYIGDILMEQVTNIQYHNIIDSRYNQFQIL